MNEIIEKYKKALNKVGVIEIKLYDDINKILLLGETNNCLLSLEFTNKNDIDDMILKLYYKAIDDGLLLNYKNWNPSKESISKGKGGINERVL